MQQHIRREAIQDVDRQLESNEKAERARLQACVFQLHLLFFDKSNNCLNLKCSSVQCMYVCTSQATCINTMR